jgi:hypothetical protein
MPNDITRSSQYFYYICNKHPESGIQRITVDSALNLNCGCSKCGAEKSGKRKRTDESVFKAAAEKVGFIYVGVNYENNGKDSKRANIEYICPNHKAKGVQTISYNNLKVSRGNCWYCAGKGRSKEDLQKELCDLGSYVTVLEYIDYASPVKVKCDICGREWTTSGTSLVHGSRCGFCSKSGFELSVCGVLDSFSFKYDVEHIFDDCRDKLPLPFDFYIPDFNIAIEADGEGHYHPIRRGKQTDEQAYSAFLTIQKHDKIKTEYCNKNGISLIRIPFWEKENLKWFLWDELVKFKAIEEIAS